MDPRRMGKTGGLVGAAALVAAALILPAAAQTAPPLPPPRPEAAEEKAQRNEADEDPKLSGDAEACFARLTGLGLIFERRPAQKDGACEIGTPVLVSALAGGIDVSPASLMSCSFAESLARWTTEVVRPESSRHFQAAPKKLLIGTSYQCRDQRTGGKLSEHAFGNGVDVMGLEFDKRAPLIIGSHGDATPEAAFQTAIRSGACPIFTTVLGPGSDGSHGDHLHLDMRTRKGGYRICQ